MEYRQYPYIDPFLQEPINPIDRYINYIPPDYNEFNKLLKGRAMDDSGTKAIKIAQKLIEKKAIDPKTPADLLDILNILVQEI